MKLPKVFTNFFSSTLSPRSLEYIAGNLDVIGKASAGVLAVLYIVGLIIFGLYHSALHIRGIELFKVRYLFVGFYYILFVFLHLICPSAIKRLWLKAIYFIGVFVVIVLLSRVNTIYFSYLLAHWTAGNSYFEFKPEHLQILNGNLAVLAMTFFVAPFLVSLATEIARQLHSWNGKVLSVPFLIFAVFFKLQRVC